MRLVKPGSAAPRQAAFPGFSGCVITRLPCSVGEITLTPGPARNAGPVRDGQPANTPYALHAASDELITECVAAEKKLPFR